MGISMVARPELVAATHDIKAIRERNRADMRRADIVDNVMDRLDVYAAVTFGQPLMQMDRSVCREHAERIVRMVTALSLHAGEQ
jgi:hypothetical protein